MLNCIIGNPKCKCRMEDIPDPEVTNNLKQLIDADERTFAVMRDAMFPDRANYGFHKYSPKKGDVMEFANATAHELQISRHIEEIHSFMEGLSTNGVLRALRFDKVKGEYLLTHHDDLITVEKMKGMFNVKYFGEGEILEKQENVYMNFITFLEEVSVGQGESLDVLNLEDIEDGKADLREEKRVLTLSSIVRYLTGGRYLSRSEKIEISFVFEKRRVQVNTCSFKIEFPVCDRYTDEDTFSVNATEDFLNSPGFGQA